MSLSSSLAATASSYICHSTYGDGGIELDRRGQTRVQLTTDDTSGERKIEKANSIVEARKREKERLSKVKNVIKNGLSSRRK